MNLIKKFFANNLVKPKDYIVRDLIAVSSQDPHERLHELRKHNLQKVIIEFYNGSMIDFAKYIRKHENFVHSLLQPLFMPNSRIIETKMARLFELHIRIKTGSLDEEMPSIIDRNYIPFIAVEEIPSRAISERESIKYYNKEYPATALYMIDTSGIDQITFSSGNTHDTHHKDLLGHIIVINTETEKIITMIRGKHKTSITGELIDTLNVY